MKKVLLFTLAVSLSAGWLLACTPALSPAAPTEGATTKAPGASAPKQGWEKQWDELIGRGKKEGKVTIYTSANPATNTAIAAAFKEKHGIETEFVVGKGNELVMRFSKEYSAGIRLADVIIIGASTLIEVKSTGALDALASYLVLPEVSDAKSWLGNKLPFFDKDSKIIAFLAFYTPPVVVNTSMVRQDQIKSYYDLLKPEWKGKMAMADPTVSGTSKTWVSYMMLRELGKEKGKEFMEKLIKQEPFITRDDRLIVEWVTRGKYPLVIGPYSQAVSELQLAGAPLKWIKMTEGGYITPAGGGIGLFTQRPSTNAAVVFFNWLLSKEGQAIFAKNYGAPSARLDIPPDVVDPATVASPGEKIFIADEPFYLEMAELTPVINEMFRPLVLR